MGNRGARAEMEKVEESSERVGEKRVNGGARVYICVDTGSDGEKSVHGAPSIKKIPSIR